AIRVFTLAASHLSFALAAKELNVSPSAVSHQIRILEGYLGTRLFLREPRQLQLTQEGAHLWQRLSGPFRTIEGVVDQIRQKSSTQQVNLICRPFFSGFWMASRLHSFWAAHPRVSLNLIHQNTLSVADFDRADLAVAWGKAPPANMTAIPLVSAGLSPIMHISLAGRLGVPQTPADLKNFTLLHEESRLGWNEWFDHAGAPAIEGSQSYLIDDTNVRYHSMLSGQGIMLGASAILRPQIESGELIQPFDIVLRDYRYWLVHPRGRVLTARCQTLVDWLKKEAAPAV
ncbi:MAG: LysR family transcriptional regulator, partial [Gemmobacter sp.]|nr:LysR family transcriptional regulator [Gemmobacter sp.]